MPRQPVVGSEQQGTVRDTGPTVVVTVSVVTVSVNAEGLGNDRPAGGPGQRCDFQRRGQIGQITKQDKGSGNARQTFNRWTGWPSAQWSNSDPGRGVVTALKGSRPFVAVGRAGQQGLPEGDVEVDWASVRPACPDSSRMESTHDRAPLGILTLTALGCADLVKRPYRGAEQVALVCGLVGPCPLQLGWTVGTDKDQRHCGVAGLKNRWMQVGNC